MTTAELAVSVKNGLGEGPVWIPETKALYWVDINDKAVYRYQPVSGHLHKIETEKQVTFLAFSASGLQIVGTDEGLGVWHEGDIRILADNVAYRPAERFNDAAVDPYGRLWAGTKSDAMNNHLFCMDLDGSVRIAQDGLGISNGIGWSIDHTRMYLVDSAIDTIYVYDYDGASGQIAHRRVFFQPEAGFGTPDGLTVDSEGFIWCAFWNGWKVARINPAGKVVQVVDVPAQNATSCTFGGDDLQDLYITTAIDVLTESQLDDQPDAGGIFRVSLTVRGLPENRLKVKL